MVFESRSQCHHRPNIKVYYNKWNIGLSVHISKLYMNYDYDFWLKCIIINVTLTFFNILIRSVPPQIETAALTTISACVSFCL